MNIDALRALESDFRDRHANLTATADLYRNGKGCAHECDALDREASAFETAADLISEILATASEQAPVAWVIEDSDGTKSFTQKEIDAAPWASEPGFTVRPLVYGASPAHTSEARDAARLDWLASQFRTCTVRMNGQHPYSANHKARAALAGPTFREAIDAAMRQEVGNG